MYQIKYELSLPTLNEYINIERRNKILASKAKKEYEGYLQILTSQAKFTLPKDKSFNVVLEWYNYRQDNDNVEFCQKFIFDALQKSKVLSNDNDRIILNKVHFHYKNGGSKYQIISFFDDNQEFLSYFVEKFNKICAL
jgi:Holliday junction resolvase RusA-like endonuclease